MSATALGAFAAQFEEIERSLRDMPVEVVHGVSSALSDTREALDQMVAAEVQLVACVARFEGWRHGEACAANVGGMPCDCGLSALRVAIMECKMTNTRLQERFASLQREFEDVRRRAGR